MSLQSIEPRFAALLAVCVGCSSNYPAAAAPSASPTTAPAEVILLSPGLDESKKRRVWAESAANMRERLDQMLREPQEDEGLESILEVYPRTVRFRCLTIEDEAQCKQLADALCNVERKSGRAPRARVALEALPRSAVVVSSTAPSASVGS